MNTKLNKKAASSSAKPTKKKTTTKPAKPAAPLKTGAARALLVGLTHVDPHFHNGWDGRNGCVGCAADVAAMKMILEARGWTVETLLDDEATVTQVTSRVRQIVSNAASGDCVFFYFSGHGGQYLDDNGDETDGQDETLICYDGLLIDDRLNEMWLSARAGVRIYMMSDSCNSGTNYRAAGGRLAEFSVRGGEGREKMRAMSTAAGVDKAPTPLKARMLHMGGCRDGRTSMGLIDGGVFTKAVARHIANGFNSTWAELHKRVSADVSDSQDSAFNLYPEEGNDLGKEICFRPAALKKSASEKNGAAAESVAAVTNGRPAATSSPLRAVPAGEVMLQRINAAISARDAASIAGTRGPGIPLVAEGDSWFDFKIEPDVIDWLERDYGYDIENVAKAGACVYEMAYGPDNDQLLDIFGRDPSQLEEVVRKIRKHRPKAFLFSGAGNDFAGPEFIMAIHHASAIKSGVNMGVVEALFGEEVEPGYRLVIETVTAAGRQAGLGDLPIILHGYDYAFPDGRSAANFVIKKVGPWMHPSFEMKGYPYRNENDLMMRRQLVAVMIDAIYEMLARLKADYPNVHIVNVRGTLPSRADWHDELHPSRNGFKRVAAKFHEVISKALGLRSAPSLSRNAQVIELPGPPVVGI